MRGLNLKMRGLIGTEDAVVFDNIQHITVLGYFVPKKTGFYTTSYNI